ncbi:MAG: adenosine deaminase [Ahrensia sp.]|nr:adenosine deaminase [Ahrensia sp.]
MVKAEIHCHIEGAAHPALVQRLARKYDVDLSDTIRDGRYIWTDFTSFLNCYDRASSVFRSREDYRLLTYDHYCRLAEQGAIYGEVFGSPDHAAQMGVDYGDLVDAMAAGIDDARQESGIEGRIIMTCVRHLGPHAAIAVAETVAASPHPMVTGFGMGGDERAFAAEDFAPAFEIASDAGLGLTCHAGEFADAESVHDALDNLGVTRIGHGVRSIEDAKLVDRLVDEEIVLEICPVSNIALGVYQDFAAHPLKRLFDAGVSLTINSDDPPFFDTTLSYDYQTAERDCGLGAEAIDRCTQTAIEAAFIDEPTRKRLLARL